MFLLALIFLFSLGTPSFAILCGIRDVRYPDGITPVVDYDANCNTLDNYWTPRYIRNPDQYWQDMETRTLQLTNDGPNRPKVFNNVRRHIFPINISPSQMPIATIEMFVRLSDIVPNSILFSSEPSSDNNQNLPGRVVMASDVLNMNCSHHFHPIGSSSTSPCTLSSQDLNGFVHIVTTFDQPSQLVTIWINSEFSQSFSLLAHNTQAFITVNGRVGDTGVSELSTMSFVYLRLWDRYLNTTQMRAANDEWFRAYNGPIITRSTLTFSPPNGTVLTAVADSRAILFWEAHRYTNTTQLMGSGSGNTLSLAVFGSIDYSTTFRLCRYPSMQYTIAPFFASLASCDITTTANETLSSDIEFLTITSFLSGVFEKDERYVCGDNNVRRMSYYVEFNRPVKQAVGMPLLQPIGRGQGHEFVDKFYGTSYSNEANDAWTLLSEDRLAFRWDVNVLCGEISTLRASLPDTLLWPITDDYGIPLAFSRNPLQSVSYLRYPSQTFIIGLKADIMPNSAHRASDGAYEVSFNLTWNYRVGDFSPVQDVIL